VKIQFLREKLREVDKVRYETYLMYSFRKYKTAEYHYQNVVATQAI